LAEDNTTQMQLSMGVLNSTAQLKPKSFMFTS